MNEIDLGTSALDAIDLATMEEDKVCIQRDHKTGQLAWRFATTQSDPIGMMVRVIIYELVRTSEWAARIEALERRINELEAK